MSIEKTDSRQEFDIAGLLALKAFERPDADRTEKNIQSTLQAVRAAHKRPSLHFFPDKSTAWMFAQPRYGIAALFILFLGLQLLRPPMPAESVGSPAVKQPGLAGMDLRAVNETNNVTTVIPPVPLSRQPDYSSLIKPVSLTE
ncbi:MAG TPA: hypothetical protein VJ904_05500 [Tichowtungia sp.]|nr:hypothetical protein [Tichowtungia sp.]